MPMPADEFPAILPSEILNRYRVVSHDSGNSDKLKYLGETLYGTQVWSNKAFAESDFKIVVGNIEPHQFAGFSGGVKTAAIGLSGLETINHNHALLTHSRSQLGKYGTNPVRQEIEDIGEKICIQLALNAILNQDKEIVHVLAGDPVAVMQSGIGLSQQVCQVCLPEYYDLVIASPGGHPKDINLYQAQKGIAHAALVTKPGGRIVLVAACPEGTGSQHYEDWMIGKLTYQEIIERFNDEDFRIGPHKAYQIARDASRVHLMFCSEMSEDFSKSLLLNPVKDLQSAVDLALMNL
jgi:nickel-dependent lactate racemase